MRCQKSRLVLLALAVSFVFQFTADAQVDLEGIHREDASGIRDWVQDIQGFLDLGPQRVPQAHADRMLDELEALRERAKQLAQEQNEPATDRDTDPLEQTMREIDRMLRDYGRHPEIEPRETVQLASRAEGDVTIEDIINELDARYYGQAPVEYLRSHLPESARAHAAAWGGWLHVDWLSCRSKLRTSRTHESESRFALADALRYRAVLEQLRDLYIQRGEVLDRRTTIRNEMATYRRANRPGTPGREAVLEGMQQSYDAFHEENRRLIDRQACLRADLNDSMMFEFEQEDILDSFAHRRGLRPEDVRRAAGAAALSSRKLNQLRQEWLGAIQDQERFVAETNARAQSEDREWTPHEKAQNALLLFDAWTIRSAAGELMESYLKD